MENRSFKQYVNTNTSEKTKTKVKPEEKVQNEKKEKVVRESKEHKEDSFRDTVSRTKLREEIEKELIPSITSEIRSKLEEEYNRNIENLRASLEESVVKKYTDSLIEHNTAVVKALEALTSKINSLQENLKIEIPTPVVHVSMPERTIIKKVHRDKEGNITHISEESENNTR